MIQMIMKPKDVNIVFGTPSGHLPTQSVKYGVKYVQS